MLYGSDTRILADKLHKRWFIGQRIWGRCILTTIFRTCCNDRLAAVENAVFEMDISFIGRATFEYFSGDEIYNCLAHLPISSVLLFRCLGSTTRTCATSILLAGFFPSVICVDMHKAAGMETRKLSCCLHRATKNTSDKQRQSRG